MTLDSNLPTLTLTGDCLGEVIHELMTNAVKFCNPEVPLAIRVSAELGEAGWCLTIADNGLGFPDELKHKKTPPRKPRKKVAPKEGRVEPSSATAAPEGYRAIPEIDVRASAGPGA